jgi:spore germination cell wall hydrolase CwlJ-like protein
MLYGKYPLKNEAGDLPPPPPAITVNIPNKPISSFSNFYNEQKLVDVVTACLIGEAGGEGRVGMEAVMEVIRNRAKARFGNDSALSMYKIVSAPKQFSYFNAGIDAGVARAKKHPKWKEAQNILKSAATNHTKGSTHYYAASLKKLQPWIIVYNKMKVPKVRVGNHIFFYNIPRGV